MGKPTNLRGVIPLVIALVFVFSDASGREINYKALYQDASPAVVVVYGTDGKTGSKGTGSIIDPQGLILTNTHVVVKKKKVWKKLYVFLKPQIVTGNSKKDFNRMYLAKVVAMKPGYDLALIRMDKPPTGLKSLPLSDLQNVSIGESTVAIGHPSGGAPWSLTTGRLSASFDDYRGNRGWNIYQTETSLNPGNSGGPLLDGSGALIGINTFIVRRGKSGLTLTGLNFAVKSTVARSWIRNTLGELPGSPGQTTAPDRIEKKVPTAGSVKKSVETLKPVKLSSPPKRSKQKYNSLVKPGREFGGKKLTTLFEKVEKAFNELDAATDVFD